MDLCFLRSCQKSKLLRDFFLTKAPYQAYNTQILKLKETLEVYRYMANHASAKKRIRRNARRADINGARRSRIRTFIKKIELAIASSDSKQAEEALKNAQPEIQRGVLKGILHKNTAGRKLSRLSAKIKALKQAA